VLVAPEQLVRLKGLARRRHSSVGALIREAVEAVYFGEDVDRRLAAVERLAAMRLPVADWEQMERESIRWSDDDA
jgi:hypothetical protein